MGACAFACLLAGTAAPATGQEGARSPRPAPGETTASSDSLRTTAPDPSVSGKTGQTAAAPGDAMLELYPVRDDKLVARLWRAAGQEGSPDPGRYQMLYGTGDSTRQVWLLREGTQVGELRGEPVDDFLALVRAGVPAGEERGNGLGATSFWKNFWNPADPLAPFQWPTGLEANYRWEVGVFRRSEAMLARHVDLVLTQRPLPWVTTEFGGHLSRHGGGLRRNLYNPFDARDDWNFWGQDIAWWHAAVGVPGFKWEIELANRVFSEYYWLDPNAGEGSYLSGVTRAGVAPDTALYDAGAVMRHWNDAGRSSKPPTGNLAHTLHFKAGQLRYSAHFDRDVYRSTIHELLFEDIPAPFGNLALGFVATRDAAHSRVRFDMFPLRRRYAPSTADIRIRAYFLRIDLDYRDAGAFRVAASTNVRLDGRFLRPESITP